MPKDDQFLYYQYPWSKLSKFRILPYFEIVVILRPKSVISGNLSKKAVFEQLNDQLLVNSK